MFPHNDVVVDIAVDIVVDIDVVVDIVADDDVADFVVAVVIVVPIVQHFPVSLLAFRSGFQVLIKICKSPFLKISYLYRLLS